MMHRYAKYLLLLLLDMAAVPVAWTGAWLLANNFMLSTLGQDDFFHGLSLLVLIQGLVYWSLSLYRGVWRYASTQDFLKIIKAVGIASCLVLPLFHAIHLQYLPTVVMPLYFFILCGMLGGSRIGYRSYIESGHRHGIRVLLVGAGQGGELLLRDLLRDPEKKYMPVGFLDDAYSKQGREIHGVRVLGRMDDLPLLARRFKVEQIFVGIPTAPATLMKRVISLAGKVGVPVRTLPGLSSLAKQKVSAHLLRDVSLDDLLGRDPVTLDWQNIINSLQDKIILVTGGGGSIGSELCKQIARLNPEKLIVLDHSEFNLYSLENSLGAQFPDVQVQYELASITNEKRVKALFQEYKPEIVFHAAAYKHVPILEDQIESAIYNNSAGSKIVIDQAIAAKVQKFVLISTDKAVNPTNIMGATKRSVEVYCQSWYEHCSTKFVTVRFGNVLGSAGSVIPLFKSQIEKGGPVTVTHADTMRYFMTIPEACQLIMQAFTMGEGGEIFVLEMGDPVKIKDLAEQMILLSGHRPHSDIKIDYIGLRPGEKMVEELFYNEEALLPTQHEKILQARSTPLSREQVDAMFKDLLQACEGHDSSRLIACLTYIVPEYTSSELDSMAAVS